ncbi:MAG: PAS domain S-box protein [Patescibacteria group bacterium]|nr:PAS domain S-box protein [Patescibacteria group bacterium]
MQNIFQTIFSTDSKEKILFSERLSDQATLEKLFSFLNMLVVEPETNRRFTEKYQQLLSLSSTEKEVSAIKLYKKYEEFIVENKPPIVQREYSVERLRQEIQVIIQTSQLSEAFDLLFLSDNKKVAMLFKLVMPIIGRNVLSLLGRVSWHEMVDHITQGSVLSGISLVKDEVIIPVPVMQKLDDFSLKDLVKMISNFYESMYVRVSGILGKEQAEEPFVKLYQFVKLSFPYDITSLLLDLLPDEIFEEERIEIKSRKELEKIIQEKTSQLENAKKMLEQKVDEFQRQNQKLEDIKKSMLNLLEDIQEEKEKAEEEKARDDALLDSIGDGMIAADKHNKIILLNEQAEALLGWEKEELIGRELADAIGLVYENGEAVPVQQRPAYVALSTGRKVSLSTTSLNTIYYVRKDRTKFPAFITSTPVITNNAIIGTITIFRDSTHEKEIDRMKTEFITLASHQLRTPLSAIKWFGEMLLAGDAGLLSTEQGEFVKNISISTERMIELVDSLLNISRIESGRIVIDPQPTDLKELVEGIITELGVKIQEKHQHMVVTVSGDLPKINIDQRLIRQVYLNLLTNSIKYSKPESEISISISKQGEDILSEVADTGYGIPQQQQGKIFEKFFRAENAIKVETDGTGLGLYLVRAIINSSRGKIWFRSIEGKGTSFYFSLPISGMIAKQGEVKIS